MTLRRTLFIGIGCAIVVGLAAIAFLFRIDGQSALMFEEVASRTGPFPAKQLYIDVSENYENLDPDLKSKRYDLAGYNFTHEEAIEHIELADVVMSAAEESWLKPNRFRLADLMTRIERLEEPDYIWLDETLPRLQDLHDVIVEFAYVPGPYARHRLDQSLLARSEHLNRVYTLVRFILLFAHTHGHNGEYDLAFSEIETALRLTDKLALEPSVLAHANRQTLNKQIWSEGIGILPSTGLNETSEARLLALPDPARSREVFAGNLRMQGILTSESFQTIRRGDGLLFDEMFGETVDGFHRFLYRSPLGRAIANQDAAYYLLQVQQTAQALEDGTYLKSVSTARVRERLSGLRGHHIAMHTRAPGIASAGLHVQQNEAILRLFQLGLLIEIHIKKNGVPPESLESFATGTSVNFSDPFSGNALRYAVKDGEFTLYSIGQNEIDDGGRHHYDRGDIVWRGKRMDFDRELERMTNPVFEVPEGMQSGGAEKNREPLE